MVSGHRHGEMAVTQGAYRLPEGSTLEAISAMIALGYGISYIWARSHHFDLQVPPEVVGVDAKKLRGVRREIRAYPNP